MVKIAPSILAADIMNLGREVSRMVQAGCDWLHVDIMDGHFVPNLSFGPAMVQALGRAVTLPLDVHLMIDRPERYLDAFISSGANLVTIHGEATEKPARVLQTIREKGAKSGVSLKPATPVSTLFPLLPYADMVLVMTVEPGFGGQSFMPDMMDKVAALRREGYTGIIEVDGGIGPGNAQLVMEAGANALVMGTALFTAENPGAVIADIRAAEARLNTRYDA